MGTAKPELASVKVKHHLFNILDTPRNYTVSEYRQDVIKSIQNIWNEKKIPIIVGGSTFYMSSLYFPPRLKQELQKPLNPSDMRYIENATWNDLFEVDPQRASEIDENDLYRIRRALKIWLITREKPSTLKPVFDPIAPSLFVALTRDKEELNRRINNRAIASLEPWIEECRGLKGTEWEDFIRKKGFIGYAEIFDFLDTKQTQADLNILISNITNETKQYAKKQMTFWRMLQKKLLAEQGISLE